MSYDLPQRGLVSQADAAYIENANIPRSTFINQWTRKTAFGIGTLVPILVDEIYPGDHMKYDVTAYLRLQTLLFPMFDTMRIDTHFFFVPNRLVWTNWPKFMGEQTNPGDSTAYTIPRVQTPPGGAAVGGLFDHMNIPTLGQVVPVTGFGLINALPFRMYNLIYNQWFRDENMVNSLTVNMGDTGDLATDFLIRKRAKSHDYFTSALPWPAKSANVTLPIAGNAPIMGIGRIGNNYGGPGGGPAVYDTALGATTYNYYMPGPIDGATAAQQVYIRGDSATGNPSIYADLSSVTGVSINQLRQAWMVQALLERDARGGTRYIEKIRSHFGVTNPDFRLQRPEYIGGGQTPLNITPIAQTAPTTGVALGALGAAGTSAGNNRASYAATEHGYIIGLISVKSEISYQQGLEKHWKRFTQADYYFPATAQLGEQAILRQEIYWIGDAGLSDGAVFGYQERWQELRTKQSEVTGIMRSTAAGTYDAWHLAQRFLSAPGLNEPFIQEDVPTPRVLAGGLLLGGIEMLADIMYKRTATRPIPTFGTPALIGRF